MGSKRFIVLVTCDNKEILNLELQEGDWRFSYLLDGAIMLSVMATTLDGQE